MKFLLSNDDGIDARGLEALLRAARAIGEAVVVAPAGPQSGVSHAVTAHAPVRIEPRGDDRFAVHGTPADCTRIGLLKLVPDAEWVLSGINHGGNLGADVHYSGTVAAAMEGRHLGLPAIAVSCAASNPQHYETAARVTLQLIQRLQIDRLANDAVLNAQLQAWDKVLAAQQKDPKTGPFFTKVLNSQKDWVKRTQAYLNVNNLSTSELQAAYKHFFG